MEFENAVLFLYLLEREEREVSIHWFTIQMDVMTDVRSDWNQEPGASSSSHMVLEPKHLDHAPLLSQTIRKELDDKESSWDLIQHPYGMPPLQATALFITPQHQPS